MKNRFLISASGILSLALVLSGCYGYETTSKVSYAGKISGSYTVMTKTENVDLVMQEFAQLSGLNFESKIDISEIVFENISNCEVTDLKFVFEDENIAIDESNEQFSFSYVPANTNQSLFVMGPISNTGIENNDGFIESFAAVIIPASGDAQDCENFSNIETGKLLPHDAILDIGWNFGDIRDVRNLAEANVMASPSLLIEQIANMSLEDRVFALFYAELSWSSGLGSDMSESNLPEFMQCAALNSNTVFNSLNFGAQSDGTFIEMVNDLPKVKVTKNDEETSVTCNYQNIPIEYLDRGIVENPAATESEQEDGYWLGSDSSLIWSYRLEADMNLTYEEAVSSGEYEIEEIDLGDNLSMLDLTGNLQWSITAVENTYQIQGVILNSNKAVGKTNRVKYAKYGWSTSGEIGKLYYLKGHKPDNFYMDVVLGRPVTFKNKTNSLATNLGGLSQYKKALTAKSVRNVRVVGIFDGSLGSLKKIVANEKLVRARVKQVKSQLRKLGVKANLTTGFVVDENAVGGDENSINKVVVQILSENN